MKVASSIIILSAIFVHANCAPMDTVTIKAPANLSYKELEYIIKTRQGLPAAKPKLLTPCARAILACCNGKRMNSNCSESLKCGAHFFDDNPCDLKFETDALNNALSFYDQFSKKTPSDYSH